MNLKILFLLLIYYSIISLTFVFGSSLFTEADGYNTTIILNDSDITDDEQATGVFDVLPDISRFIAFVGFGVGLPSDTPTWFRTMFFAWQTILLLFSIGFIIASIWDG